MNTLSQSDLKNIGDDQLLEKTESLVSDERSLLVEILNHLKEIDRRRLFSSLGYKSLFDYCVKRLKYSEDQAYRRISAAKLLNEIPEIESKINSGAMSLSSLSRAQTFFRREKKTSKEFSKKEKTELLSWLENKSSRQADLIFAEISSTASKIETKTDLDLSVDPELETKINLLKGLLAHSNPGISNIDLIKLLCDLGLRKWSPALKTDKIKSATPKKTRVITMRAPQAQNRYIPSKLRSEIWKRDSSKCKICESTYALQLDHIVPLSFGGQTEESNLRLLCRNCNQRAAVQIIGANKMEKYLR